jgi:hypothetical protein
LDLSNFNIRTDKRVDALIGDEGPANNLVNLSFPYTVPSPGDYASDYYLLGNITLYFSGRVDHSEAGWTIAGNVTAGSNIYNMNRSTHRAPGDESLTTFGRSLRGTPYKIEFTGSVPYYQEGTE